MREKRGRPQEKNRQEIRINLRLRTDNDPNLRRFAELLNAASNASDVIRDALRLYALYQDGELALPETLPVVAEPEADEAEFLSPEDIFGF
jgi:hypothetical protein